MVALAPLDMSIYVRTSSFLEGVPVAAMVLGGTSPPTQLAVKRSPLAVIVACPLATGPPPGVAAPDGASHPPSLATSPIPLSPPPTDASAVLPVTPPPLVIAGPRLTVKGQGVTSRMSLPPIRDAVGDGVPP